MEQDNMYFMYIPTSTISKSAPWELSNSKAGSISAMSDL